MRINHNIAALNTYRQLSNNNVQGNKALEKLSSGLRINKAGDDAAGLAISEKMRAQIRGLDQASRNAQDAISLIQTAEGGLNETHSILQRMRELATQAASDSNVDVDREEIQKEINQLTSEINRIGNTTEFNTMKLLSGGSTDRTANIRYSVETAGVAGQAATGELSTVTTQTASRAEGTGEASNITSHQASTAKVAGETRIDNFSEHTESIVASTAAVSESVKVDSRVGVGYTEGVLGPATETLESIKAGTGTVSEFTVVTESVQAAAAAEIGSPVTELVKSLEGGTGAIQGDAGQIVVKGAAALANYNGNSTVDQAGDGTHAMKVTVDMEDMFKDGIGAGETITFGDVVFTAKEGDAAGANEFNIGLTTAETIANLAAKLDAHASIVSENGANITVTANVNDIVFEVDVVDEGMEWGGSSIAKDAAAGAVDAEITASARTATYTFEVSKNFSEGDTITIGGTVYTAAGATDTGANTFKVGDTIEDTVANLVTALNGGDDFGAHAAAAGAPLWGNDTTSITITANVAGDDSANEASFSTGLVVTKTADVAGQYIFELNSNPEVGSTITIEGQTFTASADTTNGSNFQVIEGDINATVAKLVEAIAANGTLGAKYNASVFQATTGNPTDLDTVLLAEKNASGQLLADVTVASAPIVEVQGEFSFLVNKNFSAGDEIIIGGETFTAVAKAGDITDATKQFVVGADSEVTATNLAGAINLNAVLSDRFTASTALGNQDDNKVVLEEKATKATGIQLGAPTANPVGEQAGVYTFSLTDNFAVGETIDIGGQVFTAVKEGAVAANGEFNVGASTNATAASLKAAIEANSALGAQYTVGLADSDFTLTEKAGHASGSALEISGTGAAGDQRGQYELNIDSNFTIGDKITIAGTTFEAVAAADVDLANGKFVVGDSIKATTENLRDALNAAATSTRFSAVMATDNSNPLVPVYSIELTEKVGQVTGDADLGIAENYVQASNGIYTFDLVSNFAVGDTLTINGHEFTAVAADDAGGNTATQFKVGADEAATAANIKAAIGAAVAGGSGTDIEGVYAVDQVGNSISLTETAPTGEEADVGFTSGVAEVRGRYEFSLENQFSVGDTIKIGDTTFTAVGADGNDADGNVPANAFKVGSDVNDTMANLAGAIKDAMGARFEVTGVKNAFDKTTSIILEEKADQATGVDLTNPAVVNITAIEGAYTFDVDKNFAVGDRINIEGQMFTAVAATKDGSGNTAGTFEVGTDTTVTAANIGAAITANNTLKNDYDVETSGNSIALTEKTASGEAVTNPIVLNGTGVAGEYKFQMSALKAGSTVTIDKTELTLTSGGTEAETAAALKTAIEGNATLNAKYTVAVAGAEVTLTQKEGQESTTAPTLTYTTQAGAGFRTQMQIGANTGQSMTLDVNDMRADTLGVSSGIGTAGQTVEVDGKQYAVAWTATQSVTNGTDDVAVEFALDVSTHDNATAAIKVINDAIEAVSAERSKLGAYQNRLEHTINNLGTSSENLTSAESRVRDVDMAKEMMEFTKNNILTQAAQAMLAQANQQPEGVLQLLR